jgi:hypothetical protein
MKFHAASVIEEAGLEQKYPETYSFLLNYAG